MDFYSNSNNMTRFLYEARQRVWCGGFVKTEPKSSGSDYTAEIIQLSTDQL